MSAAGCIERPAATLWRLAFAATSDVPEGDDWLSLPERRVQASLRVQRRRADWRLGRWAAKRALRDGIADVSLDRISVLAAADGAPEAYVDGAASREALSISHRAGVAVAVVAAAGGVGCDIELVEPRSDAFVADYFTPDEQRLVSAVPTIARAMVTNLVWSCKESAAKALRVGLSVDTRTLGVRVEPSVRGGRAAVVVRHQGRELQGWWRRYDGFVVTVVFGPRVRS